MGGIKRYQGTAPRIDIVALLFPKPEKHSDRSCPGRREIAGEDVFESLSTLLCRCDDMMDLRFNRSPFEIDPTDLFEYGDAGQ